MVASPSVRFLDQSCRQTPHYNWLRPDEAPQARVELTHYLSSLARALILLRIFAKPFFSSVPSSSCLTTRHTTSSKHTRCISHTSPQHAPSCSHSPTQQPCTQKWGRFVRLPLIATFHLTTHAQATYIQGTTTIRTTPTIQPPSSRSISLVVVASASSDPFRWHEICNDKCPEWIRWICPGRQCYSDPPAESEEA